MKTATLSVRVDDDDAAFLAGLDVGGARTPSEKLRALLRAEKERQERSDDRVEATEMFADLLRRARRKVRKIETVTDEKSEFLSKVYDRLPEIMGAAYVGPEDNAKEQLQSIKKFETETLNEVFVFIQEVLELALTTRNRCYDPAAIEKRLEPVLEIVELINLARDRRKEGK